MAGLSFFSSKTVMVAGVSLPLARFVAQRLAGVGATVIALDPSGLALEDLAERVGTRIEPLALDLRDSRSARVLASAWESEPIHGLLNFLPLVQTPEATAGLFRALGPGLKAGKARALSLYADAPQADPRPGQVFQAAGWRGLLEAVHVPGARHRVLAIQQSGEDPKERRLRTADLALMLVHPVSDALADSARLSTRRPD